MNMHNQRLFKLYWTNKVRDQHLIMRFLDEFKMWAKLIILSFKFINSANFLCFTTKPIAFGLNQQSITGKSDYPETWKRFEIP